MGLDALSWHSRHAGLLLDHNGLFTGQKQVLGHADSQLEVHQGGRTGGRVQEQVDSGVFGRFFYEALPFPSWPEAPVRDFEAQPVSSMWLPLSFPVLYQLAAKPYDHHSTWRKRTQRSYAYAPPYTW